MRALGLCLCVLAGCAAPVVDVHGVPETPYDAPDSCWIGDVYVESCCTGSECDVSFLVTSSEPSDSRSTPSEPNDPVGTLDTLRSSANDDPSPTIELGLPPLSEQHKHLLNNRTLP